MHKQYFWSGRLIAGLHTIRNFLFTRLAAITGWARKSPELQASTASQSVYPEETPAVPGWILPETEKQAVQRAKARANRVKWLLTGIYILVSLPVIIFLATQSIPLWLTVPLALPGLILVWIIGLLHAAKKYQIYLPEELVRYPDKWKDYYFILLIQPGSTTEEIDAAYRNLSGFLQNLTLTEQTSEIIEKAGDIEEAYQILSNPSLRAKYDYAYQSTFHTESLFDDELKNELLTLSQSITEDVRRSKRRHHFSIPFLSKFQSRIAVATISILLILGVLGTSLAIVKPENALAAPFRGTADIIAHTSVGFAELINYSRQVAASSEFSIVSTALQSMKIMEGIPFLEPVTTATNDMAQFPSGEYSLFPDYLDRRYSQFRYTVNSQGTLEVDTSWATTDGLLNYMIQLIEKLEQTGQSN